MPPRRACRASVVFAVIAPAAALSGAERRFAIESGPEFVDIDGDYPTPDAPRAQHLLLCASKTLDFPLQFSDLALSPMGTPLPAKP